MRCGVRLERLPVGIVSHTKHHGGEPLIKGRVIGELFVEFHVVRHQIEHHVGQHFAAEPVNDSITNARRPAAAV